MTSWREVQAGVEQLKGLCAQKNKTAADKRSIVAKAEKALLLVAGLKPPTTDTTRRAEKSIRVSLETIIAHHGGAPRKAQTAPTSYGAKSNFDGEAWFARAQAKSTAPNLPVIGTTSPGIRKEAAAKADMRAEYLRLVAAS